jgi:hypothetical protein
MTTMVLLAGVRKKGGNLTIMWFLCDQLHYVENNFLLGKQLLSTF